MQATWYEENPSEELTDEVASLIDSHGVNQVLGAFLKALDDLTCDMGTVFNYPVDSANCSKLHEIMVTAIKASEPPEQVELDE